MSFLERILSVLPARIRIYILKLSESEINRKIAKGASWSIFGTIISKGLLLLSSVVIARLLGAEVYGEAGIIRSTVNMFTAFAGMGLGLTATKYIAEYKKTDTEKVSKIIALSNAIAFLSGFIFAVLIIIFSKEIASKINAPHLDREIQVGAIMLLFNSLNGVQAGILAGFEDFKSIAKNNLWAGVISFFVQIIATYIWGLMGAIVGFGINFLVLWLLNKLSIRRFMKDTGKINIWDKSLLTEVHILWKFSLPAVLSGIMVGPITWVCNAMLVNQQNGYKEMGLFDIANQWRMTILFIPAALSQIILPMLSSSLENKNQYKGIFYKNLKLNVYISIAITLLVIIMTPLITGMYGSHFVNLKLPLIIMSVTTTLVAVNSVIGQVIASQGRMWLGFMLNLFWAFVLIASAYLFVDYSKMGAIGLSISYLISYVAHTFVQFVVVYKSLDIQND